MNIRQEKWSNPRPAILAMAENVCSPNDIRQGFTGTRVDIKGRPRIMLKHAYSLSEPFDVTGEAIDGALVLSVLYQEMASRLYLSQTLDIIA